MRSEMSAPTHKMEPGGGREGRREYRLLPPPQGFRFAAASGRVTGGGRGKDVKKT